MNLFTALLIAVAFAAPAQLKSQDSDPFDQLLLKIEIKKTADRDFTQQALKELEKNLPKLTTQQKQLYQFYSAHADALAGEFSRSIESLQYLIATSKDQTLLVRFHALLSNVYLFAGQYENAFRHASIADAQLDEMQDSLWHKYTSLQNLTSLFKQSGLPSKAVVYARQMLKTSNKTQQPLQQCGSYVEMASLELMMNNLSMARIHADEGLEHCHQAEDSILLSVAIELQAQLLARTGKPHEALTLLLEQHPTVKQIDYKTLSNTFEARLAIIYAELGDYKNALKVGETAYQRAESMNDRVRMLDLAQVLATAYSELGELEQSIFYYRKFLELEKEREIITNQRKMAYLMVSSRNQDHQ